MPRDESSRGLESLRALARATVVLEQAYVEQGPPPGIGSSWAEVYALGRLLGRLMDCEHLDGLSQDPALSALLESLEVWIEDAAALDSRAALENLHLAIANTAAELGSGGLEQLFDGYEHFLADLSPEGRRRRGVYFTPISLVRFVLRGVSHLLREHFDLGLGLGDSASWEKVCLHLGRPIPPGTSGSEPFLRLFDPAVGTGAFLVEARRMALESAGVPPARMGGAEIMLTARLMAEVNLRLAGGGTGTEIKWCNTLGIGTRELGPVTVVVGNPPYSGLSANREFRGLVEPYYSIDGERIKERKSWLQDDYVKFFRWAQERIDHSTLGIIALVTPHGFLDNPTFRGMRHSLLKDFDHIYVVDLHGNANRGEHTPAGALDANVFQIRQGVAVSFWVRCAGGGAQHVKHADCWASSVEAKLRWLDEHGLEDIRWTEVEPASQPFGRLAPGEKVGPEYAGFLSVREIFPLHSSGIITSRDRFLIDGDRGRLLERIELLLDPGVSDDSLRERFGLKDNYAWSLGDARERLRQDLRGRPPTGWVTRISYRPFVRPWVFFHPAMVWRPRVAVMSHLQDGETPALVTVRQLAQRDQAWRHVAVSRGLVESCFISNKTREINYVFPLYLQGRSARTPNISSQALDAFAEVLGLCSVEEGAEAIFDYTLAVLHSEAFRQRYRSALAVDFPRVPVPADRECFAAMVTVGTTLRRAFLRPLAEDSAGPRRSLGSAALEAIRVEAEAEPSLWETRIGGYQVSKQWLQHGGNAGKLTELLGRLAEIEDARLLG
jgi:predicted helicase